MKPLKLSLYLLFILTTMTRCCCERFPATDISKEEQDWLPYVINDTIRFRGSAGDTLVYIIREREFIEEISVYDVSECSRHYVNALKVVGYPIQPDNDILYTAVSKWDDSTCLLFDSPGQHFFYKKMDTLEVDGKILRDVYAFDEYTVSNVSILMGIHKRYYKHGIGLVRFETTKKSNKYDLIF